MFSGFGGHFQKHQVQIKTQSRGQDKDENVYESNSAQSLSLTEIPAATLLCIRLSLTKFMAVSPPVIPVMGCNPGGSCFCLLNGQPLSHMEYGQLWLLALAADGPLFCFKSKESSRIENGDSRQGVGKR